ncbi:MAG: hypothetical protein R3A79_03565 [Nannocystaceae bacterium]
MSAAKRQVQQGTDARWHVGAAIVGVVGVATAAMALTAASAGVAAPPPTGSAAAPGGVAAEPVRGGDPLAYARAAGREADNAEAVIPPQCYTRTGARSNPCYACHTASHGDNATSDWSLQESYDFSDLGRRNHWTNLFVDRRDAIAGVADEEVLAYVREDNYAALRAALRRRPDYPGYAPDLDFARGFDAAGFAVDGSAWRAYSYKPFVGAFWPTNGSAGDAMIRLPEAFRSDALGASSRAIYAINLALLEAAVASDPALPRAAIRWPTEPLDEGAAGIDLDGDGRLGVARELVGLPAFFVGGAADRRVRRGIYPEGAEFLHSVRYLDPDAPGLLAARMKELRYARKVQELDRWALQQAYDAAVDERQEGKPPRPRGGAEVGLLGDFGWQLQGFIEDADGALRLQSYEEHLFCMGCHDGIGVTVDQSFSFPRKRPGAAGWRYQSLDGLVDAPQLGHAAPEYAEYMARVGGGDELRQNGELLARFFAADGALREGALDGLDVAAVITPSRSRALALDKAYWLVVREQSFVRGRDAVLAPVAEVHREIGESETELAAAEAIFRDGQLRLAWPEVAASEASAR